MAPLAQLAHQHNLNILSYADNTQLILSLTKDPRTAKANLHEGMKSIAEWMRNSRLKLKSDKTEVLILGRTPSAWDDSWWPTSLGAPPTPTDHARNLGFILDSSLSMSKQVNAVSSSCYYTLRMLRRIYKWMPTETRRTVTQALVSSRLDYGNALYTGIPAKNIQRLQRIQNASAQLVLDVPHLPSPERPKLTPCGQEDHLQAPHPRSQGTPQRWTSLPEQQTQLLHPHPPTLLRQPRPRHRSPHPA
ncbi:hypothetical protein NDU88_002754 [Pleurodeles waltl]|uniref:Reverse transcriptase domain-containing protein n=1 Tax=Pleurodeles waltl TaxID=8319 RepID=A0AAV7LEN8_PLEWA|nr:hypothetical protein NDU88_002754 [Pleurodeles waltl]